MDKALLQTLKLMFLIVSRLPLLQYCVQFLPALVAFSLHNALNNQQGRKQLHYPFVTRLFFSDHFHIVPAYKI
jgi:hypothetical protein